MSSRQGSRYCATGYSALSDCLATCFHDNCQTKLSPRIREPTGPEKIPIPLADDYATIHPAHGIPYHTKFYTLLYQKSLSRKGRKKQTNKGTTRSHPTNNTIRGNNVAGNVKISQIPCLDSSLHHFGLPTCAKTERSTYRAAYKLLAFHPQFV